MPLYHRHLFTYVKRITWSLAIYVRCFLKRVWSPKNWWKHIIASLLRKKKVRGSERKECLSTIAVSLSRQSTGLGPSPSRVPLGSSWKSVCKDAPRNRHDVGGGLARQKSSKTSATTLPLRKPGHLVLGLTRLIASIHAYNFRKWTGRDYLFIMWDLSKILFEMRKICICFLPFLIWCGSRINEI